MKEGGYDARVAIEVPLTRWEPLGEPGPLWGRLQMLTHTLRGHPVVAGPGRDWWRPRYTCKACAVYWEAEYD